jgi:RNA polymerase sigma-70 factor (ECF subfamily)
MERGNAAVARAQAGESEAFRDLVEQYSGKVFALAYRVTGNSHDAEDVVQEAFLRAYRALSRFDARADFGTWLHRIAANCAIDVLRARKRRGETGARRENGAEQDLEAFAAAGPGPEAAAMSAQRRRGIEEALAALSERERAAFVMRHFEQMPVAEIARSLHIGTGAVKQSVFRAVRKLRRSLRPAQESFL